MDNKDKIIVAKANGYVDDVSLAGILAEDGQFVTILPVLWERFWMLRRNPEPLADDLSLDGRFNAWHNLITRWTSGFINYAPAPYSNKLLRQTYNNMSKDKYLESVNIN